MSTMPCQQTDSHHLGIVHEKKYSPIGRLRFSLGSLMGFPSSHHREEISLRDERVDHRSGIFWVAIYVGKKFARSHHLEQIYQEILLAEFPWKAPHLN